MFDSAPMLDCCCIANAKCRLACTVRQAMVFVRRPSARCGNRTSIPSHYGHEPVRFVPAGVDCSETVIRCTSCRYLYRTDYTRSVKRISLLRSVEFMSCGRRPLSLFQYVRAHSAGVGRRRQWNTSRHCPICEMRIGGSSRFLV